MKIHINICLIGGTGRCGTTILKRIFQAHPEVAKIPEWRFAVDPDGIMDFYSTFSHTWSPHLFDVKLKRLNRLLLQTGKQNVLAKYFRLFLRRLHVEQHIPFKVVPRYADFGIIPYCPNYKNLVRELMDALSEFRFQGAWIGSDIFEKNEMCYHNQFQDHELKKILSKFLEDVIQDVLQTQQTNHFVEDNTWNILWFDQILELLPDAKLVHIYRDPRDVVASFVKMVWAPSNPEQAAIFYRDLMESWWKVRSRVPQKQYMEISLESIVAEPEIQIRKIAEFWNIPFHKALLQTDLSRSHSGRYKKDFTASQISKVEDILSDVLNKLGYTS